MSENAFIDLYELMQISPGAESETVQRVYRMLAQRYHPDNRVTGSHEKFRAVHEAYRILSDPVLRAKYDVEYHALRSRRWKVFDHHLAADGFEIEKRTRYGILAALYAKRRADPNNAGVSLLELESLLGRPREHLEFSVWFLREKSLIRRTDDSFFLITADGVEKVEEAGLAQQMQKLLESAESG